MNTIFLSALKVVRGTAISDVGLVETLLKEIQKKSQIIMKNYSIYTIDVVPDLEILLIFRGTFACNPLQNLTALLITHIHQIKYIAKLFNMNTIITRVIIILPYSKEFRLEYTNHGRLRSSHVR